jgi:hypothetical protein
MILPEMLTTELSIMSDPVVISKDGLVMFTTERVKFKGTNKSVCKRLVHVD